MISQAPTPDAPLQLLAPLDGIVVPLHRVPDPVFAGGMMGAGLAVEPLSSTLCAPCAGVVVQLAKTGHALTLRSDTGAEVLMHIGIDTVHLQGKGFTALVALGDKVQAGQPLIDFDLDNVAQSAQSLQTIVVVTGSDYQVSAPASGWLQAKVSALFCVSANVATQAVVPAAHGPELSAKVTVRQGGGLHARPSASLQAAVQTLAADVHLEFAGQRANARSVTALMGLGVGEGDEVCVHTRGRDAQAALDAAMAVLQTATPAHAPSAAPKAEPNPSPVGVGLRGVCAATGVAVGTVVRMDVTVAEVPAQGEGVDQEFDRLVGALQQVRVALRSAVAAAQQRAAQAEADIFGAHLSLADDPELIQAAEHGILQGQGAGSAWRQAVQAQCTVLLNLGNPLLAERANDLKDLEQQTLAAMGYHAAGQLDLPPDSVLLADDLTPSMLTQLPRERVVGFATVRGGATSHVAILARALGIPALVAVGPQLLGLQTGQMVCLDAGAGVLHIDPSAEEVAVARQRIAQTQQRHDQALKRASWSAQTQDGVTIEVAANIANEADARQALRNGADGVGLLRTEFLFEGRTQMPTVAEQVQAYQSVLDALEGRTAIIRTLDVGGDKEAPYLRLPAEENPALGLRGIRTGFAYPQVLDDQLRALLSVRPLGHLRVLIPMVSEVSEVLRVRQRLQAMAQELGVTELPQLGVMIEVPSAALLAEQLAQHVDFFSIGTNDLTQYTLAMDRCHPGLASRQDPLHPAVLRLIALTVAGAKRHGKWVGMCGAMASDPQAVPVILGLGVTELSVSAALVPEIKTLVRSLSQAQCQQAVQQFQELEGADSVRAAAGQIWPPSLG